MPDKPFAHIACGNADNSVLSRVIRRRTPKQFDSDDPLFQGFEMANNRLVNNVLKKLPAPLTALKCFSLNDFLDMLLKQGDVFLGPCYFR